MPQIIMKKIQSTRYSAPKPMPAIANPLPLLFIGSLLICASDIKPIMIAAGEKSRPIEQHQPMVIAAAPEAIESTANVCVGDDRIIIGCGAKA